MTTARTPKSSDEYFLSIAEQFRMVVREEKLYLKPGISLDEVSAWMGVSRHTISFVINRYLNKSLTWYINELRLTHAAGVFLRHRSAKITVAEVAQQSGFGNRKSFHRVCRTMTGFSPNELRAAVWAAKSTRLTFMTRHINLN